MASNRMMPIEEAMAARGGKGAYGGKPATNVPAEEGGESNVGNGMEYIDEFVEGLDDKEFAYLQTCVASRTDSTEEEEAAASEEREEEGKEKPSMKNEQNEE